MLHGGSQAKRNLQSSEEEHGKGKGSSLVHDFPQFIAEAIDAKKHFWLKDWEGRKKITTIFSMDSQNRYVHLDV